MLSKLNTGIRPCSVTEMKQMHARYLDFMSHLHEVALDLVTRFRFDKKHPWHLGLVLLYGTMLELHGSICVLIREDIAVGVPILLRTVVEANLDFTNLANDKKYGYHLRAAESKEWIKILREARKGDNPFLAGIAATPNLYQTLSEWEAEFAKLKQEGYSPLRQNEKFAKASLDPVYKSVYNFLCCHSHNNLRALVSRHVNISPDETEFNVEYYAPLDMDGLLPYVDSLCGIVVSATETIHRLLDTGAGEDVLKLKKELDELRKLIQTEQSPERASGRQAKRGLSLAR